MRTLSRCRRLLAVGAAVLLGACGASGPMAASSQPDHAIAGPQGGKGQFVVACAYSHASLDDPIVFPGQPGASHRHVFFGNVTTDAASTIASLDSGGTSCEQQLDRAAYWAPALMNNGTPIEPVKSVAYYRAGIGVDPTTVVPYPHGLMMVAGNPMATSAQPTSVVAWTCGAGIVRDATPPTCPAGRGLRMVVTFPDCWDGLHLDAVDHRAHMAYSSHGQCPHGHPMPVPQLQFSVEYAFTGSPAGLELASGGLLSGHADFMNAWDTAKLSTEVALCLHRNVVCGVNSGKISG